MKGRAAAAAAVAVVPAAAALALLAAPAAPARAQTPWYQVEALVFAQGREAARRTEGGGPRTRPFTDPPDMIELFPHFGLEDRGEPTASPRKRRAFRMLPGTAFALRPEAARLDASRAHRVLLHVAWQQPGFPPKDAVAVHLGTVRGATSDARFAAGPGEAVDGIVRIWRQRFVHVEAEIAFGDAEVLLAGTGAAAGGEAPGAKDAEGGFPGGRIRESRRLREGTLHYFDHPRFGLLLSVRRLP